MGRPERRCRRGMGRSRGGGLGCSGIQSLAGFGIHSKFSALVANTTLLTPRRSWGGDTAGACCPQPGFCGALSTDACSPHPYPSPRPTWGSVPEVWLMGAFVSVNTVSPHDPETKRSLMARAVRLCPCRGDWVAGVDTGRQAGVTAHDGSSSPGLCTSHRDAAGAPCSGQTRPGRRASPRASACGGTR